MAHERGGARRTPEEQAAWVEARFGVGRPPPLTPAEVTLAADFPDDPELYPDQARAAIAAAEAAGIRLGRGQSVPTVAQRREAGTLRTRTLDAGP